MFYQFEHIGAPEHLVIEKNCNYSFPPHIHECFEILTLTEGYMNVYVDKKSYQLKKGESIMIFPNQIHSLDSTESTHSLCIFSPNFVKLFLQKTKNKIPVSNKFIFDRDLSLLFEQLQKSDSEMFKKGILYLICDTFHSNATYQVQNADRDDLLYTIFTFVDKNFDGDCSLSTLAKKSGYNYSYISRYFKSVVGMDFNAYVTNFRLNHACYLIKNNAASILQCAMDSGFSSLRTFNRSFKQRFGVTPTQYKSKIEKAR